jgi:hypothetical protein
MRYLTRAAVAAPLAAAFLSAAACSSPPSPYTQSWLKPLDADTQYVIAEQPGGFQLIIQHQHYQYRAEDDALRAECVRTFNAAAKVLAERRNRTVDPLGIQDLEMSNDRNIFTGISTCNANATVTYAR